MCASTISFVRKPTKAGIKDFGIQQLSGPRCRRQRGIAYKVTDTLTVIFSDREDVARYTGNELPADYAKRPDTLLAEKA
ncbi:MAG: hypothetical protein M3410_03895 [Acidobacteriota bacterium]|nr:hypothetical protein [Acidobacteriota bacterium]